MFWGIHTREKGKDFGNGQQVVPTCWLSTQVLAVATQWSVYIHNIIVGENSIGLSFCFDIWGMVHSENELLVGTLHNLPKRSFFNRYTHTLQPCEYRGSLVHNGEVKNPILVGKEIACISPETGVWLSNPSYTCPPCVPKNLPLLGAARSLAVSLGRNIVIQTDDSIQIFSSDVLMSGEAYRQPIYPAYIYPLGRKYIICIQPDGCLIVLELETSKELCPDNTPWSPLTSIPLFGQTLTQSPFACGSFGNGILAELGISEVMKLWKSGTSIYERAYRRGGSVTGFSPMCALEVSLLGKENPGLEVKDAKKGYVLGFLPIRDDDPVGIGKGYDLVFETKTRFYLKLDEPEQCTLIPFDIIASYSGRYTHTIIRGKPVQEPQEIPLYTLDANCEWVIDGKSRKICWIPPGNIRRGDSGHFWAGLSLVMVGDDGIVRKLSFRELDC